MTAARVKLTAEQQDDLRSALPFLDANSYFVWVKVAAALHPAGADGYCLWDEWSRTSPKYNEDQAAAKWQTFADSRGARNATYKSILRDAQAAGWVNPRKGERTVPDDTSLVSKAEDAQAPAAWPPGMKRVKSRGEEVYKASLPNLRIALAASEKTGYTLALDDFAGELVMRRPGGDWVLVTDANMVDIRTAFEDGGFESIPKELFRDALVSHASRNRVDTFAVWSRGLVWDGVDRIERFFVDYCGAADNAYVRAVGLYLWTALGRRSRLPGCQVDMVPVLVGRQGLRKSSTVQALAPEWGMFAEIDLAKRDADFSRQLRGKAVGEISELRGLNSKDMDAIKTQITRRVEAWIPKYAEKETHFPRRCVFVGTTNEEQFLSDATGERRWLPVKVGMCKPEAVKADLAQLWAEGVWKSIAYRAIQARAEAMAPAYHAEHKVEDTLAEALAVWVDTTRGLVGDGEPPNDFTVRDALVGIGFDLRSINRGHEMRAAKALHTLGFQRQRKAVEGVQAMRWSR